ncbi:uncharacterized protein LOC110235930 [Exaiptasia diaphana]|uniref:Uncharacterized protein n=1 Tax=Exaiptasia diaphana TaxID=2652724 RepID=A0A913X143_EXADI|nr:uncharacterized protein LOC110235930 [Exaiptasia diaphana]KXJ27419.1 hypothetical protein AC249_AIPGENE2675 [Exaiptasia diaphana]
MEIAKIEVDSKSKDEEKESFIIELPSVIIVSDQLFTSSGKCKLLQLKQVGGLIGYYWRIELANRTKYNLCLGASDDKAMFKIFTMVNDQNEEINIIESVFYPNKVITLDKVKDRVIIKNCPMAPTRIGKQDLIRQDISDILLKRISYKSSAERFMFQFFTKGYGLGFGSDGKPMKPSTVRLNQAESIFRFV